MALRSPRSPVHRVAAGPVSRGPVFMQWVKSLQGLHVEADPHARYSHCGYYQLATARPGHMAENGQTGALLLG